MEETEEKDFFHIVTMHNHTPFRDKYSNVEIETEGVEPSEEAQQYYHGLTYSDQDLKDFVQALDESGEKSIVVFWGDHLPGFYESELFTQEGRRDRYETPLLVYSNLETDSEDTDIGMISPIHFMNHVFKLADASVSPYIALLMEMEENIPAMEKGRYFTENSFSSTREELEEEQLQVLNDYDLILYDFLVGNEYSKNQDFFYSFPNN